MQWFGIVDTEFLITSSLQDFLNNKLLPFLKTTADPTTICDACIKITAAIPNEYTQQFPSIPPLLFNFHNFVVSFLKKQLAFPSMDTPTVISRMIQILIKLNDHPNVEEFDKQVRILCKV